MQPVRLLILTSSCRQVTNGANFRFKSSKVPDGHFSDPGIPRVAITKDKRTFALYHPKDPVNYEYTIPIPRDDPKYSAHESLESLVRERLDALDCAEKSLDPPSITNPWPMSNKEMIPTIMHLANMFYTSKHRWFPTASRELRKPENPPKDRPSE